MKKVWSCMQYSAIYCKIHELEEITDRSPYINLQTLRTTRLTRGQKFQSFDFNEFHIFKRCKQIQILHFFKQQLKITFKYQE